MNSPDRARAPVPGEPQDQNPTWVEKKAPGFATPTDQPASIAQQREWQAANRTWWEEHPMRYDWKQPLVGIPGESAWFEEIDRRFFPAAVLPENARPFGALLPQEELEGKTVLEIGVGMGSHAQLIAQSAGQFVGIDLSRPAIYATRRRFDLINARGAILQMDAENLAFPDASFDIVWSWGVIHHSANTRKVLEEIRRVLRPQGRAMIMVYHRALVPWYIYTGFLRGVLQGGLLRYGNLNALVQSYTDGAVARYYSRAEWIAEIKGLFDAEELDVYGNRAEFLPLPAGPFKDHLLQHIPEGVLRFWLTTCKQGTLLFSRLRPR